MVFKNEIRKEADDLIKFRIGSEIVVSNRGGALPGTRWRSRFNLFCIFLETLRILKIVDTDHSSPVVLIGRPYFQRKRLLVG